MIKGIELMDNHETFANCGEDDNGVKAAYWQYEGQLSFCRKV